MGQHHARIYSELAVTDLVDVYDHDEETAAEVADSYRTSVRTPTELFETADAVSIAVTTDHHYELARQSLEPASTRSSRSRSSRTSTAGGNWPPSPTNGA